MRLKTSGAGQCDLVKGYIEDMPLESGTVDVIISNCVINLSPDKGKVLKEARVLPPRRPVLRLRHGFPPRDEADGGELAAWSGWAAGALQEWSTLLSWKKRGSAGRSPAHEVYEVPDALAAMAFPELSAEERNEINGALASALILAKNLGRSPQENGAREQQ